MNNLRMAEAGTRRSMLGITLLELMTVVLVIGILGVIALPSYRQYVMRAQRTEAKNALLQLQTNQERFYLANRTYGTVAQLVAANLLPAGGVTERGTYTLSIDSADFTTGYTATADPTVGADINMTQDDQCTSFTITSQGVRTATGADPTRCW